MAYATHPSTTCGQPLGVSRCSRQALPCRLRPWRCLPPASTSPASTMGGSDCPAAILPPLPLRLVGSSFGNDRALPSSNASNSMTCRGLRPRRGADTLTATACRTAGFGVNDPLARRKKRFRGSIPSLALRPIICLSFGSAQFVASLCSKFRSGPVVSLWPGWIIQLVRISFTWRTVYRFVGTGGERVIPGGWSAQGLPSPPVC